MKKIILTLALGMLTSFAFPQSYHKLIRTNTFWDEYTIILPEWCYTSGERVFFTNQDTIINGFTYKISKQQRILQVNPGPFCPPFVVDTAAYTFAFLREDTIAGKVYTYLWDYYGSSDKIIYDFSLMPGDTLKSSIYSVWGETLILDSIGNVVLNNGESRKVFWFNFYPKDIKYSTFGIYYIEGIGGGNGLVQSIVPGIESWGGYFCVKENSINLYGDQCDYGYVGQNEMEDEPVSVFPNPANSFVNIVVPLNFEASDFKLLNLQGQEVFNHKLIPGSNSFSISEFIPGVYFYQVKSNQVIHNGKLTIY